MIKKYMEKMKAKSNINVAKVVLDKLSNDLFFGIIYEADDKHWIQNINALCEANKYFDLEQDINLYKANYELYKETIKNKIS